MILDWAILGAICVIAATATMMWLTPGRAAPAAASGLLAPDGGQDPVWLYDEAGFLGANASADRLMQGEAERDWQSLHDALASRFPGFPDSPDKVRADGLVTAPAADSADRGEILCEWLDGIARVRLRNRPDPAPARPDSTLGAESARELETLRAAMNQTPYPVWRLGADRRMTWHNAAYGALCRKVTGQAPDAETPLFPADLDPVKKTRQSIAVAGTGQRLWFDVSAVRQGSGTLFYAADINAVVDAEIAQRNFVQTLAKTFAQLSIGLAIFDRNRQLALFNPALIDLTALPADFLSARPNLLSFFDRLRDQRMMPEPKNYGSWRHQMADLVEAASDGRYQETWSLPSGSVYSVSGRPHPDGAIAFLFEDITAEITLTRRFRSDLELGLSILDQLDEAIVVFAADGTLTTSNAPYRALWGVDPDMSFAQVSVVDATRVWQELCLATPIWGDLREFVETRENRAEWWAQVELKSGAMLICSIHPLPNGATLVCFRPAPAGPGVPALSKTEETAPA